MFSVKKLDLDAGHEQLVVLRRSDAKELGFSAKERIKVSCKRSKKSLICVLEIIDSREKDSFLSCDIRKGQIGLISKVYESLELHKKDRVSILPAESPKSVKYVRDKFLGKRLDEKQMQEIVCDIAQNKYSQVETTYFVLASTIHSLDDKETIALTRAMINVGKQLNFKDKKDDIVVDKHCIGGIPGNRTTMIVVPIVAAAGLYIPKTSSRSITSPAGTADTMEVLANVKMSLDEMYHTVKNTKACVLWGGALDLSPADDIIIQVEHPLGIDSEGQMIASILSKKKSVGSTHVLLDIPIGPTAKVKNMPEAKRLAKRFEKVGSAVGLKMKVVITDGREPIGRGIGPYLEAMDVLKVLRGAGNEEYPKLKHKVIELAGEIFDMAGKTKKGEGIYLAQHILESGKADEKFQEMIDAQGRKELPKPAKHSSEIKAYDSGIIKSINNKKISKLAFILGNPSDKTAGLFLHRSLKEKVKKGEVLFEIFSNSKLKLKYAKEYFKDNKDTYKIE